MSCVTRPIGDAAESPMDATVPAGVRCWGKMVAACRVSPAHFQTPRFGGGTGTSAKRAGGHPSGAPARRTLPCSGAGRTSADQSAAGAFSLDLACSCLAKGAADSEDSRPALTAQQSEQGASLSVLETADETSIERAFSADIFTQATTWSKSQESPDAPSQATRAAHAIVLRITSGTWSKWARPSRHQAATLKAPGLKRAFSVRLVRPRSPSDRALPPDERPPCVRRRSRTSRSDVRLRHNRTR